MKDTGKVTCFKSGAERPTSNRSSFYWRCKEVSLFTYLPGWIKGRGWKNWLLGRSSLSWQAGSISHSSCYPPYTSGSLLQTGGNSSCLPQSRCEEKNKVKDTKFFGSVWNQSALAAPCASSSKASPGGGLGPQCHTQQGPRTDSVVWWWTDPLGRIWFRLRTSQISQDFPKCFPGWWILVGK